MPQIAIPTPIEVRSIQAQSYAPEVDAQIKEIVNAMRHGHHSCEARNYAHLWKREVYARMAAAGWNCHLGSCPREFEWSPKDPNG